MDPNETLRRIRALTKRVNSEQDLDDGPGTLIELAELVEALDQWMSAGGFGPHEWQTVRVKRTDGNYNF